MATLAKPRSATSTAGRRIASAEWQRVGDDLDAQGFAVIEDLLGAEACGRVAGLYPDDAPFRSRIVMARHGFGRGEYKYFAYPLPDPVEGLRTALYPQLAEIANRWNEAMGIDIRYPADHAAVPEALPRRRAGTADAAAAAVRGGRLQLPAPGPLRRARVSAASGDPALRARP